MDDLAAARKRIDAIDAELLRLIEERLEAVDAVRQAKQGPPLDPAREHELLARLQADTRIEPGDVEAVFRAIMGAALRRQGGLRVAFLGPAGTWSHRAVRERFGSGAEPVPCGDLPGVVEAFVQGDVGHAVLPVHNDMTGPILSGLRLVQQHPVAVVGRTDLKIRQSLLGPDGSIEAVHSHPEALAQCRDALRHMAPDAQLVPATSTAAAMATAKALGQHALGDAEASDLPLRHARVSESHTRFLILGHEATRPTGRDRTLLVLRIPDAPGSLNQALSALADHGADLRSIQAMPVPDGPGSEFIIELAGHREDAQVAAALGDLHARASALRVLGSYPVLEA